ncbi:unnamed protein product, partial [Didymodactylos carnosus]
LNKLIKNLEVEVGIAMSQYMKDENHDGTVAFEDTKRFKDLTEQGRTARMILRTLKLIVNLLDITPMLGVLQDVV